MQFKDDFRKPLHSDEEFTAGLSYLELLTNIQEAKKLGTDAVSSGYERVSLEEAIKRQPGYRREFRHVVERETKTRFSKLHGVELVAKIRERQKDILASIMDTSYYRS